MAAWSILGGVAPAALFGALGLLAGATTRAVWPLAGVAAIGACIGGLITQSTSGLAPRHAEAQTQWFARKTFVNDLSDNAEALSGCRVVANGGAGERPHPAALSLPLATTP